MFERQTVIITGAGASWHYGYPTGEELVKEVVRAARMVRSYYQTRIKLGWNANDYLALLPADRQDRNAWDRWQRGIEQCDELIDRLQSTAPLVIDYFLGWNQHLGDLGRTLIAFVLLRCEANGAGIENINRPVDRENYNDNWMRFVVHELLLKCPDSESLKRNRVDFITFNYDTSLEVGLRRALAAAQFLQKGDVEAFLAKGRFLHMYGALQPTRSLGTRPFQAVIDCHGTEQAEMANRILNECHQAAQDLRVIDPHTKDIGAEGVRACELLDKADVVYFLGFGFDLNNLQRLGYPSQARRQQRIYFTNRGNSMAVNKRVANAFALNTFREPATWHANNIRAQAEKSIRDCYDAMALDFGAFDPA